MRAQAATKIGCLADVEHGPRPVAEYVHSGRGRCLASCAFAHAAPMFAPIFENEGLFDERPCESGCRSANAEYFAGKPLVIRRLAGREASEQSIPQQDVVPWNVNTFEFTRAASITCIRHCVPETPRLPTTRGDGAGAAIGIARMNWSACNASSELSVLNQSRSKQAARSHRAVLWPLSFLKLCGEVL